MKPHWGKLAAVVIVLVASVVYVLPSWKPNLWPYKKIHLGLDLQGGIHLILEVQSQKAVESFLERQAFELRDRVRKAAVHFDRLELVEGKKIVVSISGKESIDKFEKILADGFKDLRIALRNTDGEVLAMTLDVPDKEAEHIRQMAVQQALETIRNRVDQFGVSEPDIRIQGDNRILVQLPGIKETQRAKELIGKTALLEFKLVDESHDVDAAVKGNVPAGTELLYETREDKETRRVSKTPFLVQKRALLTGNYLTDARVQIDSQYNEPYVAIKFDKKGAQLFEKISEENVKRRLAIVLDGKIYSAPVIQERIAGGEARITGRFTTEEARDLAIVLRAGALPAPVVILEERTVGPSLGSDSIRQGIIAAAVGGILVVLFMAFYYKTAGLIADLALIFNILLIVAGLAGFGATLTLPGIAGIVLTIGMAVDANVLIFERIREELRAGKSPRAAIDAGFRMSTWTILDSNITTLIAAVVLFQFGTGPVKGFAVTLTLGILSSVFSALVMTRLIFDAMTASGKVKTLRI
ncbi:MAG: protein translocase subunit SecD [Thermodesulfobacteriota bacterium]